MSTLQWIIRNAAVGVQRLPAKAPPQCTVGDVCMLLVSSLTLPPFLLSALAARFAHRAGVAMSHDLTSIKLPSTPSTATPTQSTPYTSSHQRRVEPPHYGRYYLTVNGRTFEYAAPEARVSQVHQVTFARMSAYLRCIVPSSSEVFTFTIALCNILAILSSIFNTRASPIHLVFHTVWVLFKYNLITLISWMLLVCLCDADSCTTLYGAVAYLWRWTISSTHLMFDSIGLVHSLLQRPLRTAFVFTSFQMMLYALRRRFAAHTLHEPEAWYEWFASGIRFSRPAVAFYGGRPTFFFYGRTSTHKLSRRVQQLAQQLGIAEHMIATSVEHEYLFDLPVHHYNDDEKASHQTQQRQPCFRCANSATKQINCKHRSCRCTRALRLAGQIHRLRTTPCRKCGYDGRSLQELIDEKRDQCSICLDNYKIGQAIVRLPCAHAFHRECVLAWLLTDAQQTCPICRRSSALAKS